MIQNCKAENVACLYGGYGRSFVLRNIEVIDSASLVNTQRSYTSSAAMTGFEFDNITADLHSQEDGFFAIRSNGGNISIKNSRITMNCSSSAEGGIILLRDKSGENKAVHSIVIESSVLKTNHQTGTAYAIYNHPTEGAKPENITVAIDSASTVIGGQNF